VLTTDVSQLGFSIFLNQSTIDDGGSPITGYTIEYCKETLATMASCLTDNKYSELTGVSTSSATVAITTAAT
jgi:hypothetical protein